MAPEAMEQQLLLRSLQGKTRCLRFAGPHVSCEDIKARVFEIDGILPELQRIVTGTQEIQDGSLLKPCEDGMLPSCAVLLRLRGGKGGFGSLLRGAATKAGQKKTSNFDACRDMSGRRLRHVNAERRLKEWKGEAELREMEKVAEEYLKKDNQKKNDEKGITEDLKKYREQTEKNMEEVEAAVLAGLKQAKRLGTDGKRKKIQTGKKESKKLRRMAPEEGSDDDDDDIFTEPLFDTSGASTSSSRSGGSPRDEDTENSTVTEDDEPMVPSNSEEKPKDSTEGETSVPELKGAPKLETLKDSVAEPEEASKREPLKLDDFETAKDLEALGLERLKFELQQRGLKCGGSLSERAGRLFLLKTTTIEKLDKKHFAAKSK